MMSKKREATAPPSFTLPKKRQKEDVLKLTSDPTSLAIFLKRIEENDEHDLIRQYLTECNYEELILLLESGPNRKQNEITVILKVLAIIIIRTNRDLNAEFASVGRRVAEAVLEDVPLSACLRSLRPSSSADASKAALQLLAAVVSGSPFLGRSLLRSLNLENSDWVHCSRRRNTKDEFDVRTCFINFVASFFLTDNNLLIREFLEAKNMMFLVISECFTDKFDNILLILKILQNKVVENTTISKTIKMRIFSRISLKNLSYLYDWRGEAVTAEAALKKCDSEVDHEAAELIRISVHKLLHTLTSSAVMGIVFREHLSSDASKQNEHLLYLLLSPPLNNAFNDSLRSELVMDCLLACPSLLLDYLAHWIPSFEPRSSDNWLKLMNLIIQIFSHFRKHIVSRALQLLDIVDDMAQFVKALTDLCLPPVCMVEPLLRASRHSSTDVTETADLLFHTLRKNLRIFLTWAVTTDKLMEKGASSSMILAEVTRLLPERILVDTWFSKFSKLLKSDNSDVNLLKKQIVAVPIMEVDQEDIKESAEVPEEKTLTAKEEIRLLPKDIQKNMRSLLKISLGPKSALPGGKLEKLLEQWPLIVSECFKTFSMNSTVLRCLATGVRLLAMSKNAEASNADLPATESDRGEPRQAVRRCSKMILRSLSQTKEYFSVIMGKKETLKVDECTPNRQLVTLDCCSSFRESVLDLLLALGETIPKLVIKKIPVLYLLAAYSADLSVSDKRILQLLYRMDIVGNSMSSIWGMQNGVVIWSDRVGDYYHIGESFADNPTLWREPTIGAFLTLLDKDRLLQSSLSFPVNRRCLAQSSIVESSQPNVNTYDPCFLLPLFLRYLSPGGGSDGDIPKGVDLRGFFTRNCLCFAVAALSSYSRHLRGLAKTVIGLFRHYSEVWKPEKSANVPLAMAYMNQYPERIQLNFILDTLRNSLSDKAGELSGGPRLRYLFGSKADTSFRLTRVHANFFIHAMTTLSRPDLRMYEVFWNCFLAKPAMDLGCVPEFLRMMFSVHEDFQVERHWMVKLCADSVNDTSDYLLLEKSRVFKHCLLIYSDAGTDTATQIQILRLLMATTKMPRACHALTRFHAFPLWLFRHALTTTRVPFLCYFLRIIAQMISAFEDSKDDSPGVSMLKLLDKTFRTVHDETTFAERKIKPVNV